MDVHQLQYFVAALDHGSVNAAAQRLGVAQPTVSQAIRGLERELGTALFHRIGRGMVPTSAGHALASPARQVLRGVTAAGHAALGVAGRVRGTLELAALPSMAGPALTGLIARFCEHHPCVDVAIDDVPDEAGIVPLLRSGSSELVVTHLPAQLSLDPDGGERPLETLELGRQQYCIALPPDRAELVPDRDPLGWHELPDVPQVIVPGGGSHAGEIVRAMARAGRNPAPVAVVEQREARLSFVLAGVGASFVERGQAQHARERGAIVRSLDPPLSRAFGLVYDPRTVSEAGAAFVGLARSTGYGAPAV
ncbi:LysR family transcriptional regulator [Nocardiopsis sp. HNM0947]|uniref:LysR family transcriptional regulator n=1 Tax=Nocardiopsis coralli TaxID=2772213 RepID=A0ABR9P389_9ACTN|nr:LysR family transcriptional regulator [Nocardiopsis coralli]MBE2998279.1 LysR family transcriptional regulator [Nocardiopsis coralli]